MASRSLITALDIGTRVIKILVVKKSSKGGEFEVVSLVKAPAKGMSRRGVSDDEQLIMALKDIIHQAEQESSLKIREVYLNIGGSRFKALPTHSLVSVSRADREISREDMNRVLQAAKIINLPSNHEIWGVVPKEFIIDDQKGIQKPRGMKGARLEVEGLLLTIFTPSREKIERAVSKAGLNIKDTLISSLASAEAVVTSQEKEKGVAVVDIGAGLTKIAIFKEGALIWTAMLPLGSENITDDLAVGLPVDFSRAEEMKKELKSSFGSSRGKRSKTVTGEKELMKIIKSRVEEILEEINKQILTACHRQDLPAGVILTGAGANLKGIEDLAEKEFKLPVRLGYCSKISGLEKDLGLATVAGLALMANQESPDEKGHGFSFLKNFFRIFNP